MRRPASALLTIACAGLLGGCTGMGVFFDHTTQYFSRNPNMPAGSSETFLQVRGEKVDVPPLLPEKGNIWPDNTGPDLTLDQIEQQQNQEIRRGGGQPGAPGSPPPNGAAGQGPNPSINRANQADQGLPPPNLPRGPIVRHTPAIPTPNGPALDTTNGSTGRGYRQLQNGPSGQNGILVPNGNGTSTLIGPDGSVQTVPTKP